MGELQINWDTDLTQLTPEKIEEFVHTYNPRTSVEDMSVEERDLYDLVNSLIGYSMMLQMGGYDLTPPVTARRIIKNEIFRQSI